MAKKTGSAPKPHHPNIWFSLRQHAKLLLMYVKAFELVSHWNRCCSNDVCQLVVDQQLLTVGGPTVLISLVKSSQTI